MPEAEATGVVTGVASGLATATFAGGCFWCMEPPYDEVDGVSATISGYIGGDLAEPTYKQVSSGRTGHTEAVQIQAEFVRDNTAANFERAREAAGASRDLLLDGAAKVRENLENVWTDKTAA